MTEVILNVPTAAVKMLLAIFQMLPVLAAKRPIPVQPDGWADELRDGNSIRRIES